jgi:hypothetical protein
MTSPATPPAQRPTLEGGEASRIASFEEFWPFYVSQHTKRGTRALHFAGTTLGFLFLARAVASGRPVFVLWGLVAAYGLAWIGHFFIEKNRPATFQYPFWSLLGDMKMYGLMWRGRMTAEAARLGYARGSPAPAGTAADHPVS